MMDIPRVLKELHSGVPWGNQASSTNTYAELFAAWPGPAPLSSEADMLTKWGELQAADVLLPTPADARARVNAHVGSSVPKLREIVSLLLEERLASDPDFLKRNGIDI